MHVRDLSPMRYPIFAGLLHAPNTHFLYDLLMTSEGRRHGQNKAQAVASPTAAAIPVTTAAIPIAIAAIPIAIAAIPITTAAIPAANATTLQNASPPGPDEGETFDLENISGDEEEPSNLPAPATMTPVGSHPSPLQTITSTIWTDPLATSNLKQAKGQTDIAHFYWVDPDTKGKTCIPCKTLHEIDEMHKVMVYAGSTSTSAPQAHAFTYHTELYLEAAEHFGWHILIKDLSECIAEGWTLATIHAWLKKLPCTIQSLGPPPNQGSGALLVGASSPEDAIPDFTLDEMHCQIVKFIVANDQAINMIECPEFRHLIRFLRPEIGETGLFHCTNAREIIIEQWQEYFLALKTNLANAQGKVCFTSDLWSDYKLRPFMALTAHWIAKADKDSMLMLKVALIAFHYVPGVGIQFWLGL
ncbi:hypothetical protein EV424DRAFT_1355714 [Suillus variegatus]|nr:hypothetical protein EV424DRAFT_1355714 [Suillus variegatus]